VIVIVKMKNAAREERDVSMGLAGGGEVETSIIGPIIIGSEMTSEEEKRKKKRSRRENHGDDIYHRPSMGTMHTHMYRQRVGVAREGEITSLVAGDCR
jgi:hypothetical protein